MRRELSLAFRTKRAVYVVFKGGGGDATGPRNFSKFIDERNVYTNIRGTNCNAFTNRTSLKFSITTHFTRNISTFSPINHNCYMFWPFL
jgi:hypothetical protein